MSTYDDLRDLRDALDSIVHGALPRWSKSTTQVGAEAQRAAIDMYERFVRSLLTEGAAKAAADAAKRSEDQQRAHAEALTARCEAVERERDEARRELQEILAVIHRDGGHYTGEHGIAKSVADAHATWAAVMLERDALREALQWYVEHDDTNEGGKWEESNAGWLEGKRRAQALLGKQ